MNDNMPETFEVDDESLQQLLDSEQPTPDGPEPEYHPILQVWQAVLEPAKQDISSRISPQWAQRIIHGYPQITYADLEAFRDIYITRLLLLASYITEIIQEDPEALNQRTPAEDLEHNSKHYRTLLRLWNQEFLRWEHEWHTSSPTAAIELAAGGEVFKIFFGSPQAPGIVAHLDTVGFEYTEADQKQLLADLEAFQEGL